MRIILAGGGTGGHLYPGLAIAQFSWVFLENFMGFGMPGLEYRVGCALGEILSPPAHYRPWGLSISSCTGGWKIVWGYLDDSGAEFISRRG
jgi:hypothetical protein